MWNPEPLPVTTALRQTIIIIIIIMHTRASFNPSIWAGVRDLLALTHAEVPRWEGWSMMGNGVSKRREEEAVII